MFGRSSTICSGFRYTPSCTCITKCGPSRVHDTCTNDASFFFFFADAVEAEAHEKEDDEEDATDANAQEDDEEEEVNANPTWKDTDTTTKLIRSDMNAKTWTYSILNKYYTAQTNVIACDLNIYNSTAF